MEFGGSLGCGGGLLLFAGDLSMLRHGGGYTAAALLLLFDLILSKLLLFLCSVKGVCVLLHVLRSVCVVGVIRLLHAFSPNTDSMSHMLYTCSCMIFPFFVCRL
mgnify:FL=1